MEIPSLYYIDFKAFCISKIKTALEIEEKALCIYTVKTASDVFCVF